MRGVCAAISCLLAALALSGCIRAAAPVAMALPQNDLDSMAYGQTYGMAAAPTAIAYAAAPAAAGYDTAHRLYVTLNQSDSSGSMRIVVPLGTALGPGDTVLVGERWF